MAEGSVLSNWGPPDNLHVAVERDDTPSTSAQMRAVYAEARTIARAVLRARGRPGWGTGTLVNEAFVRLLGSACEEQMRTDPTSVVPVLRRVMNNALTDQGRREQSAKRPQGQERRREFYDDGLVTFDDDPSAFLDILDALADLRDADPAEAGVGEPAKLVEVLELGFVLGCSTREIAVEVGVPQSTAARWLRYGRAKLNASLHRGRRDGDDAR